MLHSKPNRKVNKVASNPYEGIIPWRLLRDYLRQQLAIEDHKLRRAGDGILVNQGRAQVLEELLNLPSALENFAQQLKEDSQEQEQKVQA